MAVDTSALYRYADGLAGYRKYWHPDGEIVLQQGHHQIQEVLNSFILYFRQSAQLYEKTEEDLMHQTGHLSTFLRDGRVRYTHYENWNVLGQLTKQEKKTHLSVGAQWAYKEAGAAWDSSYLHAGLQAQLGHIEGQGSCEIGLWKDKEFDPSLDVSLGLEASVLSAQAQARVGTQNVYLQGQAQGSVGVVYAQAECVLNQDEQELEASVGAAALKGEASLSFHVFGAKVTLSAQGSLGSAEAGISYHHRNREWEFGSKLGFIAGLGFRINVSY